MRILKKGEEAFIGKCDQCHSILEAQSDEVLISEGEGYNVMTCRCDVCNNEGVLFYSYNSSTGKRLMDEVNDEFVNDDQFISGEYVEELDVSGSHANLKCKN